MVYFLCCSCIHVGKYTGFLDPMGGALKALISTTHYFKRGFYIAGSYQIPMVNFAQFQRGIFQPENEPMPYDERRFPASLQLGEQMLSFDCVLLPSRFEARDGAAVMPAKDFAAGALVLQWEPTWKPAKGKPAKDTNVLFQKFADNSGKIVQNLFAEVNGSSANALAQHLHFLPEAVSGVHLLSVEILCRPYRPPIVYFSATVDGSEIRRSPTDIR